MNDKAFAVVGSSVHEEGRPGLALVDADCHLSAAGAVPEGERGDDVAVVEQDAVGMRDVSQVGGGLVRDDKLAVNLGGIVGFT